MQFFLEFRSFLCCAAAAAAAMAAAEVGVVGEFDADPPGVPACDTGVEVSMDCCCMAVGVLEPLLLMLFCS